MNKNVKRSSNNSYSEEQSRRLETKLKEKKDINRTNQMYNRALKDLDVEELENMDDMDDMEYELIDHKVKGKK